MYRTLSRFFELGNVAQVQAALQRAIQIQSFQAPAWQVCPSFFRISVFIFLSLYFYIWDHNLDFFLYFIWLFTKRNFVSNIYAGLKIRLLLVNLESNKRRLIVFICVMFFFSYIEKIENFKKVCDQLKN